MRLWLAALAISSLLACGTRERSIPLEPRWAPLARVVEADVPSGAAFTHGAKVQVRSLSWFLSLSDRDRESLLRHERVHAERQFAVGVDSWEHRYAYDPDFRLAEEKLGYEAQIRYLANRAGPVHADDAPLFAWWMSSSVYGGMISYPDAHAWCESVYDDELKRKGQ